MPTPLRRPAPATHSRHAWRVNARNCADLAKPSRWIEPLLSRDDAISEARRIAEEESPAGCGWAWEHTGHWYAADFNPRQPGGFGNGGFGEIVTVDIPAAEAATREAEKN